MVYAVVVVPDSREAAAASEVDDATNTYTPPPPVLRLRMHRGSYHVEYADAPALPVFQRTGGLASGNETTQLSVSEHRAAPFAQLRAGFLASYEDTGLNHRIGLPNSYGRYAVQEEICAFRHTQTGADGGVRLLLRDRQSSDPTWLLLQFEVPRERQLRISCTYAGGPSFEPLQNHSDVAAVLLTIHSDSATVYHLAPNTQTLIDQQHPFDGCVFMDSGVAWVESAGFAEEPEPAELLRRLLRTHHAQAPALTKASAVLPAEWRRERRVLTVNPVENMLVRLHLRRESYDTPVSVGVDDVQLAPVLSLFPPQRFEDVLCALVHVPTEDDLRQLDLDALITEEDVQEWKRVHVTLSLETERECAFVARLHPPEQWQTCPAASDLPSGLERAGCSLSTTPANVRGNYAECQVEVPLDVRTLIVAVRPEDENCTFGAQDSLVVWLRPYTALFSCESGQFMDAEGNCANCHDTESLSACDPGERRAGCPALEQDSPCIHCSSNSRGADLVLNNTARWVESNTSLCAYECVQGYFRDGAECQLCSVEIRCDPGQRWQPCPADGEQALVDAHCEPCEDLRLQKGSYAANERYVEQFAQACETACKDNFYNETSQLPEGRCKRCWDRTDLVLHASLAEPFFALHECTETTNAYFSACPDEPGARVVGSDPGFTGSCVYKCDPGWRRRNETDQASPVCEECEHPRQIILGNVTELPLQEEAFEWKLESCDFSCRLPWQSTHRAGVEATDVPSCVLCANQDDSYLCPDGQYPAGPFCLCQSCTNL